MTERRAKKRAPAPGAQGKALAPVGKSEPARAKEPAKGGKSAGAADDVALVHGRTADGEGLQVLRKQGDTLSLGEVRPLKEGKPIQGEVVQLKPRPEMPLLCDVEVQHAPAARSHAGPARVANKSYRSGWDGIWGKRRSTRASRKRTLN